VIERLAHVSRAAPGVGLAEVFCIVRAAHGLNRAAGLTGALIWLDGWFAQVLEGPAPALDACLGRIRRDPRHARLELRIRAPALLTAFAGQPLALRTRGCIEAGLFAAFDYRPGFPVAAFPADVLVEFVIAACRRARPPA
jgi:Sensors of blue-light using FAD